MGGLPRITAVGVCAVSDDDDAHRLVVAQFVDDSIDPDAVGPQAGEATAQPMSEVRVAFEFAERIENRICEHEVQRCQRLTRGAGKDDPSHYERLRAACSARTSSRETTSPAARSSRPWRIAVTVSSSERIS